MGLCLRKLGELAIVHLSTLTDSLSPDLGGAQNFSGKAVTTCTPVNLTHCSKFLKSRQFFSSSSLFKLGTYGLSLLQKI